MVISSTNLRVNVDRVIVVVGDTAKIHSDFAIRVLLVHTIVLTLFSVVPVHLSLQNGSTPPLDARTFPGARYTPVPPRSHNTRVTVPLKHRRRYYEPSVNGRVGSPFNAC